MAYSVFSGMLNCTQSINLFLKYVVLLGMVDTIFADVAQPDQARIVAINAHHFLRNEGHVVISIKVSLHC